MRLLITTQAVDQNEPVLGFFLRWIEEIAQRVESVEVICLKEGEHSVLANVRVHSLGKERGRSRIKYVSNFYRYAWRLRHDYDAVFVHMNQEYVLLGALLWRFLGKRVYLWRNHHEGNGGTHLASLLCNKVFCTSRYSYTAQYKNTVLMPVGVDTDQFSPAVNPQRVPHSILFISGMWPTKRPEMLLDALALVQAEGVEYTADFYGSPSPRSGEYYEWVKNRAVELRLSDHVTFHKAVPHAMTPELYQAHEVFVNCSPSGMFDKTLFEAAACGCRVLASSKDFRELAGPETYFDSVESLAERLKVALAVHAHADTPAFVEEHSLATLADRLVVEISTP